jgi:hypothetical protein
MRHPSNCIFQIMKFSMLIGMVVRTYYGLLNGSEATDGDDDGNVRGLKNKTRGRI